MNNPANKTRPKGMNGGIIVLSNAGAAAAPGIMGVPPSLFKPSNTYRDWNPFNPRPGSLLGHHLVRKPVFTSRDYTLAEQTRLLPACPLLGLDGGHRRHVEHAARGHRWGEDMRRPRRTDQDRSHRQRVRQRLYHLVGDVGGVEVRHDQDIGL